MRLLCALFMCSLSLVLATPAMTRDNAIEPATSSTFDFRQAIRDGLVDTSVPIEQRRALADKFIEGAERDQSPTLFYMLGTLYRQGDANGIAPFAKDIDRARDYLTRAALGGYLDAMNKLALLELDSGDQFRANLWAQLYVHYS
ncbi:MAG: hypothetical protein ABIP56_04160, partial [Dokdonella sp.]